MDGGARGASQDAIERHTLPHKYKKVSCVVLTAAHGLRELYSGSADSAAVAIFETPLPALLLLCQNCECSCACLCFSAVRTSSAGRVAAEFLLDVH